MDLAQITEIYDAYIQAKASKVYTRVHYCYNWYGEPAYLSEEDFYNKYTVVKESDKFILAHSKYWNSADPYMLFQVVKEELDDEDISFVWRYYAVGQITVAKNAFTEIVYTVHQHMFLI